MNDIATSPLRLSGMPECKFGMNDKLIMSFAQREKTYMSGLCLWFSNVSCLSWFLICAMLIHFVSFCNTWHTYYAYTILIQYNIYRYIHTHYVLYSTTSIYIHLHPTTSYYILLYPTTISIYIHLYLVCNLHIQNWRHGWSSAWSNAPRTAEARARSSDKGIALDDYRWGHLAMSCLTRQNCNENRA